jgi:protein-disulfide isomerase
MKLDSLLTATLAICALVTTGVVVHRELVVPAGPRLSTEQKPTMIPEWQTYLDSGERVGPATAKLNLIELADFECPFCGNFHKTLKTTEQKYPGQIAFTFVHFPIPGHRFALLAARVAECAGEQGRFETMYDQLFEGQDQFGLKPWANYATAAGVPDLGAFDACIKKTDPIPRVEEGKALGAKLDVQGTPTIIINGWKLGRPPTEEELDGMVKNVLAAKSPVSSD